MNDRTKLDSSLGIADSAEAVDVSSVDADFTEPSALWIGGAGDITVDAVSEGTNITFTVPAGTLLPVLVNKVYKSGTTAGAIVRLY